MKNFNYLLLLPLLFGFFFGCEEETDNISDPINFSISEVQLTTPTENAELTLDLATSGANVEFNWNPATTDSDFIITYEFVLGESNSDLSEPLLTLSSAKGGRETFVGISQTELDEALASLGLGSGETANLVWGVRATAQQNSVLTTRDINMTRFNIPTTPETLYIAGTATEVGDDPENAILLRRLFDSNGDPISKYEGYTSLDGSGTFNFYAFQNSSAVFGGSGGAIELNGAPISPEFTSTYRIRVDFVNSTYELQPINWSIVGNVIQNGWGGDASMNYLGGGVWRLTNQFIDADSGDPNKRFIFRANQDWGFVIKKLPTSNIVIAEDFAQDQGIQVDDIPLPQLGEATVTLDLSGQEPTYTIM